MRNFRLVRNGLTIAALLGGLAVVCDQWVHAAEGANPALEAARREFFESRIRPVLAAHCQECHGAKKHQGGLRLDWREPVLKGGDSGPAIELGHPEDSLLVRVLDHSETGLEMPKGAARLPDRVIKDFKQWNQGRGV